MRLGPRARWRGNSRNWLKPTSRTATRIPPPRHRSVRGGAARQHDRHQLGVGDRSYRAGLFGFRGTVVLQRIWRAVGFHPRRGTFEEWEADYRAAFDCETWSGVEDCSDVEAGRWGGDDAR